MLYDAIVATSSTSCRSSPRAPRRLEGRIGDLDRSRHLDGEPERCLAGSVEPAAPGQRDVDVAQRFDLRFARAGGAQQRRMVMELVGRAIDRRDRADRDLAQPRGEEKAAANGAHQLVPAGGERRAVEQLPIEVQERSAPARADRRDHRFRAGVVVRLVGQPGHDDFRAKGMRTRAWA
jgi:hypothetical protein